MRSGVQHGQRGTQFVTCVRDETALQRKGFLQRCDRPAGCEEADRDVVEAILAAVPVPGDRKSVV